MAQSHAERQRRYRERKCAEQQTKPPTVTKPVTPPAESDTPPGDPRRPRYLRSRGRRLWTELTADDDQDPIEIVLVEEACRLVDRLDKLDAILGARDKAWITVQFPDDAGPAEVIVDKALSEARQQQIALKQILAELRTVRSGRQALLRLSKPPAAAIPGGAGASGVADLTARIAERRTATAG